MAPSTIENLYSEFVSTFVDNPDFKIAFYERNALFFNNIKQFKDKEELRMYIEITEKYLGALNTKGRYNNAIDIVEKYQIFIDAEIKRLNAYELKNTWYYNIVFAKGMASYYINDYKTAIKVFKELIKVDNQNDRYKNWLNSSKYGQRLWLINGITIVSVILFLIGVFFKESIPANIRIPLDGIGLLGFLFTLVYERYGKRSVRRKQKTTM